MGEKVLSKVFVYFNTGVCSSAALDTSGQVFQPGQGPPDDEDETGNDWILVTKGL